MIKKVISYVILLFVIIGASAFVFNHINPIIGLLTLIVSGGIYVDVVIRKFKLNK